MDAPYAGSAYANPSTRRLRRLGIKGAATVRFDDAALVIDGAEGGRLTIAPAQVERLRSGRDNMVKYGAHYETRLWLTGERKPLMLSVIGTAIAGPYVATMRGFGAAMARAGRLDRVQSGISVIGTLFGPLLMGIVFLAAVGVALFVITNEPWWGRLIVPLAPGVVTAILVFVARRNWPRPVRSVEAYWAAVDGSSR